MNWDIWVLSELMKESVNCNSIWICWENAVISKQAEMEANRTFQFGAVVVFLHLVTASRTAFVSQGNCFWPFFESQRRNKCLLLLAGGFSSSPMLTAMFFTEIPECRKWTRREQHRRVTWEHNTTGNISSALLENHEIVSLLHLNQNVRKRSSSYEAWG